MNHSMSFAKDNHVKEDNSVMIGPKTQLIRIMKTENCPIVKKKRDSSPDFGNYQNYTCIYCLKSFSESKGLMQHIKTIHNCTSEFTKVRKIHDDDNANYKNSELNEPKSELDEIMKTENSPIVNKKIDASPEFNSYQNYTCIYCLENFSNSNGLMQHIKTIHNDTSELSEPKNEVVPAENALPKKHMDDSPLLANVERFQCKLCEKNFSKKGGLMNHIKTIHNNEKFSCDQCFYQSSCSSNIKRHIEYKHLGIKYQCDQCEYQTPRKDTLKDHLQSKHYVGPAPVKDEVYSCKFCDKKLTSKMGIKHHIQAKHSDVRFPCDQCLHQATSLGTLNRHIQLNHDGIEYQCDQCEYRTRRKDRLKEHLQKKHTLANAIAKDEKNNSV